MLQPAARRVVETRFGRYTAAVIPLLYSPLPGFRATRVQAVRDDDPAHAVQFTVFEREPLGTTDRPRAS